MESWIARTIESVLSQEGDFDIEYIVMDDASSDGTRRVAEEYAARIRNGSYPVRCRAVTMQVITQENTGMYEAINRGFGRATGDICAWINADDTYQPGAFQAVATAFTAFPDIQWIKGRTDTVDASWRHMRSGACRVYRQDWIREGIYGQESYFIEQDSCFWRTELWRRAGPIPAHYRSAGDYWLWLSFAQHAPLWSLDVPVSNFMKRDGQISKGIARYKSEQWEARPHRSLRAWGARLFFTPWSRLGPRFHSLFVHAYPALFMRQPYPYIAIEDGRAIKRRARSFIV
jgi:glycosyltransferase involved in cell wall biosynthesis